VSPVLHHSLSVSPAAPNEKASAKLSVDLAAVCDSMAEVELEVGEREVRIRVKRSVLAVPVPFQINPEATKAKFVKSKSSLRVSICER
jgi:hypothetical protein